METVVAEKTKVLQAKEIILSCKGRHGLWASFARYKYQCWTRDFVIAGMDALLEMGEEALVKRHLWELCDRQKNDGQVPILFLDNTPKWLWGKIKNCIRDRRMSFMLKRYLSKDGVEGLSPWTRDSEVLLTLGLMRFREYMNEKSSNPADSIPLYCLSRMYAKQAMNYVRLNLVRDGLMFGADWRDTRTDLDGECLLSNNCLLYEAHRLLGSFDSTHAQGEDNAHAKEAQRVKDLINGRYWTGTYYRDHINTDEFDTLGNAFAIHYDVAPPERWDAIFKKAEEVDSPFGYRVNNVQLPAKSPAEVEVFKRTNQFGVIWPFVHGFMILAALKAGKTELAKGQFEKWNKLDGFYEFYDPDTGKGYGSPDQLWSAALYLRVSRAMERVS